MLRVKSVTYVIPAAHNDHARIFFGLNFRLPIALFVMRVESKLQRNAQLIDHSFDHREISHIQGLLKAIQ